ncbi:MHYT domain-containing protein [Achromobacter sp. F4_2707]|uniref:MHYT domain-containing protein n=1 Tax=Achromobacter sp. F4_2707 TaxID=3114286 RepID=UPI0039C6D43B
MPLSGFFIDTSMRNASLVDGAHHHGLMLLSVLVSIFSATMALQTANIANRSERRLYKRVALITGAIAFGFGVWSTHFIGMLAYELPADVNYSVSLTLFSVLPACVAAWFALRMLALPQVTTRHLISSGTLVGLGVGAMHYIGMAAMQTPFDMRYEPVTFALSILVAIALATLALWVRYRLRHTSLSALCRLLISGGVMGLAIAAMHYTGMLAVRFIGEPSVQQSEISLTPVHVSLILSLFAVTVTTMVVSVNGLLRSQELYRRMREGSSRLRATLDTAVDGIITIDSSGLIQDFNRSAERLFGWTADEVIGKNIKMLMPEPYQSAHDGYLNNYKVSGKPKIIGIGREVVGLRKDGSHMPMRLAVGRVDLPGELRFVGFVSDISDRHALEVSLRETAKRAEQAAEAKSTFLANMSHEIRTPMNSIIGFTELLLQTDLTSTQRSHLNTVRQASKSLLRLINDILDTTKMEKGQLALEYTDFSMKALAMQIESSLRLAAQQKKLAFNIHYPDDMPDYFRGDSLRVLQILTNLVGNAVKFTESGSVDVVFAYDQEGVVHIQVKDTGIGMTPQQSEAIFQPFAQADASISRRFGGTGLGTTIARQLAEQMGGGIDVESVLGYGSTFHLRLPLKPGRLPEKNAANVQRRALPPLKILIADDVPQNLELLTLVLEQDGHAVETAQDGNEAVALFGASRFDVVLMDVHMPGLDGLQAARLIRQFERKEGRAPTPIIALTASVMDEDREAAQLAGMDGFSTKPLDAVQLFREIERVLGASQASLIQPLKPAAVPDTPAVIDWNYGLSLWGSKDTLLSAIARFLDTAEEQYPLPRDITQESERNRLLFSLHGLRGAAANLALPELAGLAGQLEDSLRAGAEIETSQLEHLNAKLMAVRHRVSEENAAAEAEQAESLDGAPKMSDESLQAMRDLIEIMRGSGLDDDLLDRVCSNLERSGEHRCAQELRSALDEFEFNEAVEVLERVLARYSTPAR